MMAHGSILRRPAGLAIGPALILIATATLFAAAPSREEWQQPDRVVADLGLRPGARVADVGAGQGYFTFRLAKAVGEGGKVFATDIDAKALEKVKERAAKEGAKNIETVPGEPTDTRLAPDSVDAVLLCDVVHHVPEESRLPLMKNIVRAMKSGALLFLVDWRNKPEVPFDRDRKIPQENLVKLATDAGLALDAEFHYLKWQVFLRFRKPPAP